MPLLFWIFSFPFHPNYLATFHFSGLAHEQQRVDRDKYIKLNLENVVASHEHNFALDKSTTSFGVRIDGSFPVVFRSSTERNKDSVATLAT